MRKCCMHAFLSGVMVLLIHSKKTSSHDAWNIERKMHISTLCQVKYFYKMKSLHKQERKKNRFHNHETGTLLAQAFITSYKLQQRHRKKITIEDV